MGKKKKSSPSPPGRVTLREVAERIGLAPGTEFRISCANYGNILRDPKRCFLNGADGADRRDIVVREQRGERLFSGQQSLRVGISSLRRRVVGLEVDDQVRIHFKFQFSCDLAYCLPPVFRV